MPGKYLSQALREGFPFKLRSPKESGTRAGRLAQPGKRAKFVPNSRREPHSSADTKELAAPLCPSPAALRSDRHRVAMSARLSWKSTRKSSFTPSLCSICRSAWRASNECPPISKNWSARPIGRAGRIRFVHISAIAVSTGSDGASCGSIPALRDDRCRKLAPINLAVWRQWNLFHRDEVLRNHVLRQACPQMLAQAERSQCPRLRRHAARDNAHVVRLDLPQMHGHLAHLRVLGKHRLDLAQLDAVTTDLHLIVDAPEKLDAAIGAGIAPDHRSGRAAPPPRR